MTGVRPAEQGEWAPRASTGSTKATRTVTYDGVVKTLGKVRAERRRALGAAVTGSSEYSRAWRDRVLPGRLPSCESARMSDERV